MKETAETKKRMAYIKIHALNTHLEGAEVLAVNVKIKLMGSGQIETALLLQ